MKQTTSRPLFCNAEEEELAIVVGEFERRSVRTDSESLCRETLLLQSRNRALMNCLNISRYVLGDEILAPGEYLPQRTLICLRIRLR